MYGLVDTHAHLEEVEDLDQALKRAEKAGRVLQRENVVEKKGKINRSFLRSIIEK